MADPKLMGSVGTGASLAGTIMSAFGAKASGDAQSEMYKYQAGMARYNEKIALQNRDYASAAGEQQAAGAGLRAAAQMGSIRAGQAASGLDVNSGSAVDVRTSAKQIADMDAATIRNNAARIAFGYATEAQSQGMQAVLYDKASASAKKAGTTNMIASLISGVGSVATKWSQSKQVGLWS